MSETPVFSRRALLALGAGAAGFAAIPAASANATFNSSAGPIRLDPVVTELENPWSFAFLPDGAVLLTERPGRLRISRDGNISALAQGMPDILAQGQGGLLDVVLDPQHASNGLIYFSYSEPRESGNGTAIARARLGEPESSKPRVLDVEVIFRQLPNYRSNNHFGSRLVFAADGTLFATLGDRYGGKDMAQTLDNHLGKVIRINTDGSSPASNPFVGQDGIKPEIWSYGHRNPQGAAINPATGALWTVEHGARGGDEINIPEAGKNYGWPIITYGRDYSGAAIGDGTEKAGMEQPIHYWDPSIAPSGMMFYTGDAVPAWKGSLFIGALAGIMLVRLTLDGNKVVAEERLLESLNERIRDVRQGPDGAIYIATDSDNGGVFRLSLA